MADLGTPVDIVASSPQKGLRLVILDRRGKVLYDSAGDPAQRDDHRHQLFWHVPYNARGPFRVRATDASGASKTRRLSRR